jgi:hypothetical protein
MVITAITPQLGQELAELTARMGAGISINWWIVTLIPASEVGNLPGPADTGCVRVLPTPAANMVITCPGATLTIGTRYPAPRIMLGLALWPRAAKPAAAVIRMYRVTERIIEISFRSAVVRF